MQKIDKCMGCMQELHENIICPKCAYDNKNWNNPERALPLRTILNGKYLIGAVIGEGGFGITYAAWDLLIGIKIAIKEYFPSELVTRDTTLYDGRSAMNLTLIQGGRGSNQYQKGLERFVQEAENLAKFQHLPGIVSVKDFFYENNTAYMVMEYIEGTTLKTYLQENGGRLGIEQTLKLMEPVMKTLQEIHKSGIIHRDISPDNIMITRDGQMKLIDFGAARFVGVNDEKSLTVILKHGYAPEEQYRSNGKQGPWTDVYAISAVIYRMITGKVPEEAIQRMARKKDFVHGELLKIQGLKQTVRFGVEKGLSIKVEKRCSDMQELYKYLYLEKKRYEWKWGIAISSILIISLGVGLLGITNNKKEVIEIKEVGKEKNVININKEAEEIIKEEPKIEEVQEPDNSKILREYYNKNYLDMVGKVYFVDMTGDQEDEMVITYVQESAIDEYGMPMEEYYLVVLQNQNNNIEILYDVKVAKGYATAGIDYYLSIEESGVYIVECYWNAEEEKFIELVNKVSFVNKENEMYKVIEISEEEYKQKSSNNILLISSASYTTPAWEVNEKINSYQNILDSKKELDSVIKIAQRADEAVLDHVTIYSNEEPCVFAVTGEIVSNMVPEHNKVISIWGAFGENIKNVENIELIEDDFVYWWEGCEIYQFGKEKHYYVNISGVGYWVQHKFCFENDDVRKIDSGIYFIKNEEGQVQAEVDNRIEIVNNESEDMGSTPTYVDIFYYNNQYVEYGTEVIDSSVLEQYKNYEEIGRIIEEEFKNVTGIPHRYDIASYSVKSIEFAEVRKAPNDVYYLNYKVYGENPYENNKELNLWAHAILQVNDDSLAFKKIVFGKRKEQSGIGLAVYYGAEHELIEASKSRIDLEKMVCEKSGKSISSSCYDDFNADGKYELFAYIAESTDDGDRKCELWYTDGSSVSCITELKDFYYVDSIETLQFGREKHFALCRNGLMASQGYATTTCALENGKPCIVLQDENVKLFSENGKTYCEVGEHDVYDIYGSGRYYENYSIFYNDKKYWEYASIPISEVELEKYVNGKEILHEVMEQASGIYIKDDMYYDIDYAKFPYVVINNILLNSENEEIIINMRHWKNEEEAEYYSNLKDEDELIEALVTRMEVPCYPSEAILSIEDNCLKIKEIKYGEKCENGTQFSPLYPENIK